MAWQLKKTLIILKINVKVSNYFYILNQNYWIEIAVKAVEYWYKSVTKYNFDDDKSNKNSDFTQLVWNKTVQVGCAFSVSEKKLDDKEFLIPIICKYFPAGNTLELKENVFSLKTNNEISNVKTE